MNRNFEMTQILPGAEKHPTIIALSLANDLVIAAHNNYKLRRIGDCAFEQEMYLARKVLIDAMGDPANIHQPALQLRYTGLVVQSHTANTVDKLDAIERTADEIKYVLDCDLDHIAFNKPKPLAGIFELARFSARHERQDLALRLLDVLDRVDPENAAHERARSGLRAQCQPVAVRPYIPPARPGMISPSAIPEAIRPR